MTLGATEIGTISAAVVVVVQLIKAAGVDKAHSWWLILSLSAVGLALYATSQPVLPVRTDLFNLFAAWGLIATAASGVYGLAQGATAQVKGTGDNP